jgi:hypothetical protein
MIKPPFLSSPILLMPRITDGYPSAMQNGRMSLLADTFAWKERSIQITLFGSLRSLAADHLPAPKLAGCATDFAPEKLYEVGRILESELLTDHGNRQGGMREEPPSGRYLDRPPFPSHLPYYLR